MALGDDGWIGPERGPRYEHGPGATTRRFDALADGTRSHRLGVRAAHAWQAPPVIAHKSEDGTARRKHPPR